MVEKSGTGKFKYPTGIERKRAIGEPKALSPKLRLIFDIIEKKSKPIPRPGPCDWLYSQAEKKQTYEIWNKRKKNEVKKNSLLYIQPLEEMDSNLLLALKQICEIFYFGMKVVIRPLFKLAEKDIKLNDYEQYNIKIILAIVRKMVPSDAYAMLCVLNTDLFLPGWAFFFGWAEYIGKVGVFSFCRYHPEFYGEEAKTEEMQEINKNIVQMRASKLMCHEMLHMFGMEHCCFFHCLMNGTNGLHETDPSPLHLCPMCLRKLQQAIGFDIKLRFERLAQLLDKFPKNFEEEKRYFKGLADDMDKAMGGLKTVNIGNVPLKGGQKMPVWGVKKEYYKGPTVLVKSKK